MVEAMEVTGKEGASLMTMAAAAAVEAIKGEEVAEVEVVEGAAMKEDVVVETEVDIDRSGDAVDTKLSLISPGRAIAVYFFIPTLRIASACSLIAFYPYFTTLSQKRARTLRYGSIVSLGLSLVT